MDDQNRLKEVNAHVLKAVLKAGHERPVVALRDIYDDRGVKLLAQDKPVTDALQQRLQGRKLRLPLESSLRFEAGLDKTQLRLAFASLVESEHALATVLRPWARLVDAQIASLPLDPVVQFLLTTVQATEPGVFEHAVHAMALCGAMSARAGDSPGNLRLAMLVGLTHDIGQLYLDPSLWGDVERLDLDQYRELVTHPHVGELLLSGLPLYPSALARAVGEHHERLDGSGYASMRRAQNLSALGRMAAVVETTLGVLATPGVPLERANFALRVVPGEYDGLWAGMVSNPSGVAPEAHYDTDSALVESARAGLDLASERMHKAGEQAALLTKHQSPAVREVAARAAHLLERLRAGWNEMGLWAGISTQGFASSELVMADEELRYRLSVMQRNCLWPQTSLEASDAQQLAPLWLCLGG